MTRRDLEQENEELREGLHRVRETVSDLLDDECDDDEEEEEDEG